MREPDKNIHFGQRRLDFKTKGALCFLSCVRPALAFCCWNNGLISKTKKKKKIVHEVHVVIKHLKMTYKMKRNKEGEEYRIKSIGLLTSNKTWRMSLNI